MDGLEGTFLCAELRYQTWRRLRESGSIACCCYCRHFLVPVLSMSCRYQCCYLISTNSVIVSIISKLLLHCRLLLPRPYLSCYFKYHCLVDVSLLLHLSLLSKLRSSLFLSIFCCYCVANRYTILSLSCLLSCFDIVFISFLFFIFHCKIKYQCCNNVENIFVPSIN